jgi:hypothetical protein
MVEEGFATFHGSEAWPRRFATLYGQFKAGPADRKAGCPPEEIRRYIDCLWVGGCGSADLR